MDDEFYIVMKHGLTPTDTAIALLSDEAAADTEADLAVS